MSANPQRLSTTVDAVRELMEKRLESGSLQADERREVEMALEELEVMWEELQGQAALLERESERYAEFFEHAPDAYLITDGGGNVREANRAAKQLLGDALIGRPLLGAVLESERSAFIMNFLGVTERTGPATARWDSALRLPEGETLPVQLSVRAIPLRKSGVPGLCWLIRPR